MNPTRLLLHGEGIITGQGALSSQVGEAIFARFPADTLGVPAQLAGAEAEWHRLTDIAAADGPFFAALDLAAMSHLVGPGKAPPGVARVLGRLQTAAARRASLSSSPML